MIILNDIEKVFMKFYNIIVLGLMIGKSFLCIGSQTSINCYHASSDDETKEYICKSLDGLFNYFIDISERRERSNNSASQSLQKKEISPNTNWRNTQIPFLSTSRHIILSDTHQKNKNKDLTKPFEQVSQSNNPNSYTFNSEEDSTEDSNTLLFKKEIVQIKKKKNHSNEKKYQKNYQDFLRKGVYPALAGKLNIKGKSGSESKRKKVLEEYVHENLIKLGQVLRNGDPIYREINFQKKIFLKNKKFLLVGLPYNTTFQFNIENSYHTLKEERFSINQEIEACLK